MDLFNFLYVYVLTQNSYFNYFRAKYTYMFTCSQHIYLTHTFCMLPGIMLFVQPLQEQIIKNLMTCDKKGCPHFRPTTAECKHIYAICA